MKPMHAETKSISRCPCCSSKYRKKGSGGATARAGKKRARQNGKRQTAEV